MKDFGYDVSDYRNVDPLFGTLDDFKALLDKAHSLNLKIVIDFVLTHSSDQHDWFQESRQNKDNEKSDWYIWADPKPDGSPPNNWQAHFGGSSWSFDIRRGQYYFHNFLPEQPDINLRNPDARQAILDAARFWLDMGVDGFRLDAARHYFCDPDLTDNPPNPNPSSVWFDHPTPFTMQIHENDIHLPDTLDFIEELRSLLDSYDDRMGVAEIGGENALAMAGQYTDGPQRMHTAYTFDLTSGDKLSASYIREKLEDFFQNTKEGWPSWAFSTHDVVRAASRWHPDKADKGWTHDPRLSKMMIATLCSLQGTAFIYQGEELGLPEAAIPPEKIQDPLGLYLYPLWQGRDGSRTPIPWRHEKPYAGFTTSEPWLPIPEAHVELCVANQDEAPDSVLNFTRAFLTWRKNHPALITGLIQFMDFDDDSILGFTRTTDQETLLCLFNFSDSEKQVPLSFPVQPIETSNTGSLQGSLGSTENSVMLPPFGLFYSSAESGSSCASSSEVSSVSAVSSSG